MGSHERRTTSRGTRTGASARRKKNVRMDGFTRFSTIWAVLFALLVVICAVIILVSGLVPWKYLAVLFVVTALLCVFILPCLFIPRAKRSRKVIALALSLILTAVYVFGGYYVNHADRFVDHISGNKMQTDEYVVLVRSESKYEALSDLRGAVAAGPDTNPEEAWNELTKQVLITKSETDSVQTALDGVLDETWDAAFVNGPQYAALAEEDGSYRKKLRIIATIEIASEHEDLSKEVSVTNTSFNVLISGIDTKGSIEKTSRSDVNMIMTVNPTAHRILLTSIPRDYLVSLPGHGNALDKLTHAGIYGIAESSGALENLFGLELNYYVKVNFSTVVALIDAIGGVDVESDYAFSAGGFDYVEGMNHMDGAKALRFARERHAFKNGDLQRNINQQKVLKAILQKCTSSTTILQNYGDLLAALSDYMRTDMTSSEIKSLVRMQLDGMSSWTFEQQGLTGTGAMQTCYSMGAANVYVMIPDADSVAEAKKNIEIVMKAKPGDPLLAELKQQEENAAGTDAAEASPAA